MRRAPALLFAMFLAGCTEQLPVLDVAGGGALDAGPAADAGAGRQDAGAPDPGPMILYRFDEGSGDRVLDSSAEGTLTHLRIADPDRVSWLTDALRIDSATILESALPPTELIEACKTTGELTIEAWIVPAMPIVTGTHRLITISVDNANRNVLLGQGALFSDGAVEEWSARLRTSDTGGNGLPLLRSGAGTTATALTHVLYVHRQNGDEALWVDGEVQATARRPGSLDTWDERYRVAVANEHDQRDDDRAWLGELHQIALWSRALDDEEIGIRFASGNLR